MSVQRHFVEAGFLAKGGWIPNEAYAKTLDNFVIGCVDCVLVHREQMLIGFRKNLPHRGRWIVGGRMLPGESFEETAQRVTGHEVGIRIADPSRFEYLTTISYVWKRRAQPPEDHGCHMLGNTMLLFVEDDEAAHARPHADLEKLEWMHPRELLACAVPMFHPALRYFASQVVLRNEGSSVPKPSCR